MKYFIIIFLLFYNYALCNGQSNDFYKDNALSIELGKTGLIYNLNFDHKFRNKNFGFRVIVGSNFGKNLNAFAAGGGAYYLFGKTKNFIETGIDVHYLAIEELSDDQKGFTLVYPNYSINTFYTSINIGYRRYGKVSLFRIGLSPGIVKNEFVPGAYISYGFIFE